MTSALYIVARTVLLDALEALSAQHDALVLVWRGNVDDFRIVNAILASSGTRSETTTSFLTEG